jgi:hypothetical protein
VLLRAAACPSWCTWTPAGSPGGRLPGGEVGTVAGPHATTAVGSRLEDGPVRRPTWARRRCPSGLNRVRIPGPMTKGSTPWARHSSSYSSKTLRITDFGRRLDASVETWSRSAAADPCRRSLLPDIRAAVPLALSRANSTRPRRLPRPAVSSACRPGQREPAARRGRDRQPDLPRAALERSTARVQRNRRPTSGGVGACPRGQRCPCACAPSERFPRLL